MEKCGDLVLIHRTSDELIELAKQAGFLESNCYVGAEPLNVNLFLHCTVQRNFFIQFFWERTMDEHTAEAQKSCLCITLKQGENPAPGVLVKIASGSVQYQMRTNKNGLACFCCIPYGAYEVSARRIGEAYYDILGNIEYQGNVSGRFILPDKSKIDISGRILFIVRDSIFQNPVTNVEILSNTIPTNPPGNQNNTKYTDMLGEAQFDFAWESGMLNVQCTVTHPITNVTTIYQFALNSNDSLIRYHYI